MPKSKIYGEKPLLEQPPGTVVPQGAPEADDIKPLHERLHVDPRWTGRGITAAFLDSGFFAHADLTQPKNRIKAYYDVLSDTSGLHHIEKPDGSMWHGMMTSTVAAGNGHLSDGHFRSLAPELELVLVKVGHMSRVRHDDIERGIRWVIAHQKRYDIRILNISAGGDYEASYLVDPVCAAAEDAVRAGITVVCAVGNISSSSHRVISPASTPAVIAVGGVNDLGDPSKGRIGTYHSCYGPTIDGLQKPELMAPGIWVVAPLLPGTPTQQEAELLTMLSTKPDSELKALIEQHPRVVPALDAIKNDAPYLMRQVIGSRLRGEKVISGHYKHVDGSSFSAPIVVSIVAGVLEANPQLQPHEVKRLLIDTARRIPGVAVERQGWGTIQPAAAIAEAQRRRD